MASSTSIEIEHIRADVEQAAANLNAIVARLHARTGRGLRDSLSLLFSVPEIAALQQHASQASQYLTSGSARAATWSRSLHVQLSASTAQCQQFAVDDETLSAELSRVDEYMRGATRRMLEQARRLTGSNDFAQFPFQQQNNASSSPAQTCLAAIAHVLKIVDVKSQNSTAGVGGSRQFADPRRTHDRDAELRSLTGIKAELTELRTYVSAEAARIAGLASHVATLRRQRAALDTQNAQITALMRDMAETRRSLDAAAGTAAQMTAMASLTSTVRGTKQVAAELQRIPHGVQPRTGIETRLLAELDSARQAMARGA